MYNEAGATMPNLLLMMAFGDAELAAHLKGFLEQLVVAKELLTSDDQKMIHHVVVKDRGPLLFWLANERIPASVRAHSLLACVPSRILPSVPPPLPDPTPAAPSCQLPKAVPVGVTALVGACGAYFPTDRCSE